MVDASKLSDPADRGAMTESVISLFDKVGSQFPDSVAVEDSRGQMSYGELRKLTGKIAAELAARGLRRGDNCAALTQRSRETAALYLAIMKLGAVYVPLDPAYPASHLEFVVSDCDAKLVIIDKPSQDVAGVPVDGAIDLDDILSGAENRRAARTRQVSGDAPAYIMYTSGSTGRPKGVIVPHRGIVRLVRGQDYCELTPETRFLQLAPLAFDLSTLELWGPLLNGGCVCIVDQIQPSLDDIANAISRMKATSAWFSVGLFNALVDYKLGAFEPLTEVLAGGDVVSPVHVKRLMQAWPHIQMVNGYGPTENTTFTCCYRIPMGADALDETQPLPIGKAIPGSTAFVVNPDMSPVADGEIGELITGGDGVALGYLNRPELNAEKFLPDPDNPGGLLYRTGDLARRRADGVFEFFGRNDRQIKLSGKRIELDEIEHTIRGLPGVLDAIVSTYEQSASKRIAAFVKSDAVDTEAFSDQLRSAIRDVLPEHMIPSALRVMPTFPLTVNGKLDRKALIERLHEPETRAIRISSKDDLSTALEAAFSVFLGGMPIDRDTSFFDLGLRSMDLIKIHAHIASEIAPRVALVDLFQYTTINSLLDYIAGRSFEVTQQPAQPRQQAADQGNAPIAIIGIAGRFPKAKSAAELWANILAKRDCVTRFSDEELDDSFEESVRSDPAYVKARPILDDPDHFDAGFFGMLAREAQLTDPQQRIFLEIAWEAFEDAGYDPAKIKGAVGVYAGTSMNTYFLKHVLHDRTMIDELTNQFQIGEYQTFLGAGDFVATRTAYKLNLKGPALSIQTACSTSLTAIGEAVQNLQAGRCDMALAGGASVTFPQKRGYFHEEGGMGSTDGTCRPFDRQANGTVFGSGAGVVLLKRLDDAIADNDPIYAVIRGVGVNNDGGDKVGFTAPSVDGQARAISDAYQSAGIDSSTIGYIEAHGTATPLGDPIEFTGLMKAFGSDTRVQHCALGSSKANVGHLDAAAGVTGLISAAMALKTRTIPPLNHFKTPNPSINVSRSPFFFNREAATWETDGVPRRAGVSSFGVGGTNVHIVLEEAPDRARPTAGDRTEPYILPLSARTSSALERMKMRLADHLKSNPGLDLADVTATLQTGRRDFDERTIVVASTIEDAATRLSQASPLGTAPSGRPPVMFMFPGQGAQYPGMGRHLYASEPVYREWIDRGAELLQPELGLDIRDMLLIDNSEEDLDCPIRSTIYAQPALFVTQYAMAKLWISRGIQPDAMVGHSVGELVAAALAEAISFEDGLKLIAARGALMQAAEPGCMLAVRATQDVVRDLLTDDVDLAAINASKLCVVAGPEAAIAAFETILNSKEIGHRRLHTSHAFHSRMMDGVVADLETIANRITYAAPKIPYVSSVTGEWADMDRPVSGRYWAAHCRETVRFSDALDALIDGQRPILLEVGPGRALSTFASQGLKKDAVQAVIQSMPEFSNRADEVTTFLEAAGKLWINGALESWSGFAAENGLRISLPPYSFEPESHWIEAPRAVASTAIASATPTPSDAHTLPAADVPAAPVDRKAYIRTALVEILTSLSGDEPDLSDPETTFWDLGYDSLLMGQVAQKVRRKFKVEVTFRQIMSDHPKVAALIDFIDREMPSDALLAPTAQPVVAAAPSAPTAALPSDGNELASTDLQAIFRDQLAAMQSVIDRQMELLKAASIRLPEGVHVQQAPEAPSLPSTAPVESAAIESAPLTEPQKEIWMAAQLGDDASLTFNESFKLDLFGPLNRPAIEAAIEEIISRHDALRAHFSVTGEEMIVDPSLQIEVEDVDLTSQNDPLSILAQRIDVEMRTPFDLTAGPLCRFKLARMAAGHHVLVFVAHHMICDGWSMNVILRELRELYAAGVEGRGAHLPDARSYLGYARDLTQNGTDPATREFWMDIYSTPTPTLELPGDRPRPDVRSFAGATATRTIGGDLLARLKKMAAEHNCSLFAALFGGAQALFGKLAGEEDVVIGTPMAGQSLVENAALVGHCVNFLPQRVPFTGNTPFSDHMQAVREQMFRASDHQRYTFGSLLSDLDIKRTLNRMPLTTLQFNYERVEGEFDIGGVTSRFSPNPKAFINFDIFMSVAEYEDGLRIDAIYSSSLFDEDTINRWLDHYETLLNAVAEAPQAHISDLPLLKPAEIAYLRDDLNDSGRTYDLSRTSPVRISERAAQTPDALAVEDAVERLTYSQLDARSDQIARQLIAGGIKRHDRVAVAMDRSGNTVAAMLGVWKADCAYVPIDTNMPEARIQLILANADVAAVISDPASRDIVKGSGHRLLMIDDLIRASDGRDHSLPAIKATDTAYIMFTSGSTGVPKGVEIPHDALTNLLVSMAETTGFDRNDKLIAVTTFSFDISVLELFMPLISGGSVFISSQEEVRSGSGLIQRIRDERPTLLQATPSLWRLLLEAGFSDGEGMRLLAGGEALPRDLADALLATGAQVWNVYGPTETTIWSSASSVTHEPITIGDPLANTSLHVLDDELRLLPIGVPGDLWIGGQGLAKGYFKRPDLTDGVFRTFSIEGAAKQRYYKTGDIARRMSDGAIQLLGRSDHQVKHRGYRIEIEDIEAALRRAPGVSDAAVALQITSGETRLAGFVVSKTANADFTAVSNHLAASLPPYMVPTHWEQLDALPLNASGKLDRKALAAMAPTRLSSTDQSTDGRAPETPTEKLMASIWQDVLSLDGLSVHEPFFNLGADSLQLYRIVARMNKQGLEVSARRLMRNATLAEIAAELDGTSTEIAVAPANDWAVNQSVDSAITLSSQAGLAVRGRAQALTRSDFGKSPNKLTRPPLTPVPASTVASTGVMSHTDFEDRVSRIVSFNEDAPGTPIIALNNVAVFYSLTQSIGPSNPFYDIPMVPEQKFDTTRLRAFEDIAAEAVRLIRRVRPHGPYILLGHCVLGTVALEAAHQLRRDGETVELVVMNDSWCPGYREELSKIDKVRHKLQQLSFDLPRSWKAYRNGEMTTAEYLNQYSLARKLRIVGALRAIGLAKADKTGEEPADMENRWFTDYMLVQQSRYRPPEYDGPVAYFRSEEILTGRVFPEAMGWEYVLKGPLSVDLVPTMHDQMFRPEGAEIIGAGIRRFINGQD